jgi:hypothetical protein
LNAVRKDAQDKLVRVVHIQEAQKKGTRLSQFIHQEIKAKGKAALLKPGTSKLN